MAGRRVGFEDEVTSGSAKDVKDTAQLNTTAKERFATGKNTTKRYKSKHTPFGKLGKKGMPS